MSFWARSGDAAGAQSKNWPWFARALSQGKVCRVVARRNGILHQRSCSLLARCSGQKCGLTVFHTSYTNNVDPVFPPVMFLSLCPQYVIEQPTTHLLVQACQHLLLVKKTRFINSSLMLVLLSSQASSPPDAGSGWNHLAAFPSLSKDFIVPMASDRAVASFACTGRQPLKEQRVSLPLSR